MAREERAAEAPAYAATTTSVLRLPAGRSDSDRIAVEEPLEIRIDGRPVAVTMRTPGHDEELALGFCLSEGLEPAQASLPPDLAANTVEVEASGFDPERLRRSFYTSSSCGVCGKGALEAVAVAAPRVGSGLRVGAPLLAGLPERLRAAQPAFAATGGLHATGLFDADGELLCLREDVGRHNAMDKVLGWAFREDRLPLAEDILCVSGRLSFELVQKAAVAGCPIGVVAGLRAAPTEVVVVLPVDTPTVDANLLRRLADACADAAVTQTGPLPAAFRKRALPGLERRLRTGGLALHEALAELDTRRIEVDGTLLANVNTPDELRRLG